MVSLLKSLLAVGAKRLCGFLLILLVSKETSSPRKLDVFQAWQFRLSIRRSTLALTIATDEARLPRELAPLESFES